LCHVPVLDIDSCPFSTRNPSIILTEVVVPKVRQVMGLFELEVVMVCVKMESKY
jgi:hypothetical protein